MIRTCALTLLLLRAMIPLAAQDTFQLAPPCLRYESVFFEKAARVNIEFAQAGTLIHYTTNGKSPTQKDPVYKRHIQIKKKLTTLKAKVFGTGYLPSEVEEASFIKQGLGIKSISTTLPHPKYPGAGKTTLMDGLGGTTSHSSNTWMGFQTDTVILLLDLTKPRKVKQVLLHVLEKQDAWIFLPQRMEVYAPKKDSPEWVLVAQKTINIQDKKERPQCQSILLDLVQRTKTGQLILKIYPLAKLPDWHAGKGNPAWLFIDEVKLY